MDLKFQPFRAKLNLLGTVSEELAFTWVFNTPNKSEVDVKVNWPYDKDRTLKSLNHPKRSVDALRDVYIPILASRPDILMEVLKETDRIKVVVAIMQDVAIEHTPPAMYQEMRRIASAKIAKSAHAQLPDRLAGWVSHYGPEALDAFVWSRQAESVREQNVQPSYFLANDEHLYGHYANWAVRNSVSLTEYLEAVNAAESDKLDLQLRIRKYGRSKEFTIEELGAYLRKHNVSWWFHTRSEMTRQLLYMLPAKCFRGIDATMASYEALRPIISPAHSDEEVLNACCEAMVKHLPSQLYSEDSKLEGCYTFDSVQEYVSLPSPALYNFQTDVVDEPVGIIDGDTVRSLYQAAYKGAAKHIAARFSYTLDAVLEHVAMFSTDVPLHHVAFDPYDVLLENVSAGRRLNFDTQRALTLAFDAKFKSPHAAQKVEEIIKAIGRKPVLVDSFRPRIWDSIIEHATPDEFRTHVIAGAIEAIFTTGTRGGRQDFIEDWQRFSPSTVLWDTQEDPQELAKCIIAASQQVEPGSTQAANLQAFMGQCLVNTLQNRFSGFLAHRAFALVLNPDDVVNSIVHFFNLCGMDIDGEGRDCLNELLNCSEFFQSPEGKALAAQNEEFRNFVLEPYRQGFESELPHVFSNEVEDLIINNDVHICDWRHAALHSSKVLSFVAAQFQEAPSHVWDSYFNLAPEWPGTLGELIETALIAS